MISAWQQPSGVSFLLPLPLLYPSSGCRPLRLIFPLLLHIAYAWAERVSVIFQYHIPPLMRVGIRGNLAAGSEARIDDNDNRQECTVFFARAISFYLRWEPPSMLVSPCSFATTCSPEDMSVSSHDIMVEFSKEVVRGLEETSLFSSSPSSCVWCLWCVLE